MLDLNDRLHALQFHPAANLDQRVARNPETVDDMRRISNHEGKQLYARPRRQRTACTAHDIVSLDKIGGLLPGRQSLTLGLGDGGGQVGYLDESKVNSHVPHALSEFPAS